MAKTKVVVKEIDRGEKAIKAAIKSAHGSYVTVGVHEKAMYDNGTPVALVAYYNEFGTRFIPERSFIRSNFEENRQAYKELVASLYKDVIVLKATVNIALGTLGVRLMADIRKKISSNIPPPNEPETLDRKVGTRTLIDSKLLLNSINFEITEK